MERETKEFTTKVSKIKYTIKTWLSKSETKPIRSAYNKLIDYSAISASQGQDDIADQIKVNFDPTAWEDYRDELVKQYLVSIGDKTDNIFDEYLSMRSEDADEVAQNIETFHKKKEERFLAEGKK